PHGGARAACYQRLTGGEPSGDLLQAMLWPARIPTVTATDTTSVRTTRGVEIAARDLWLSVKGGRNVLCGVSLTIRPRELVAVVGGSGAGKTTLLEALAGGRPEQRGAVRLQRVALFRH